MLPKATRHTSLPSIAYATSSLMIKHFNTQRTRRRNRIETVTEATQGLVIKLTVLSAQRDERILIGRQRVNMEQICAALTCDCSVDTKKAVRPKQGSVGGSVESGLRAMATQVYRAQFSPGVGFFLQTFGLRGLNNEK